MGKQKMPIFTGMRKLIFVLACLITASAFGQSFYDQQVEYFNVNIGTSYFFKKKK